MPITEILSRNAELYGQETALVEINPKFEPESRITWRESILDAWNAISRTTSFLFGLMRLRKSSPSFALDPTLSCSNKSEDRFPVIQIIRTMPSQ